MKAKEIYSGKVYTAKVNGRVVPVKVLAIRLNYEGQTRYGVKSLSTGRTTTFRSAQKFRKEVGTSAPNVPTN